MESTPPSATRDLDRREELLAKEYEDQVPRTVITTPQCVPIYSITEPKLFLEAFISLLDGKMCTINNAIRGLKHLQLIAHYTRKLIYCIGVSHH